MTMYACAGATMSAIIKLTAASTIVSLVATDRRGHPMRIALSFNNGALV